jgi:hypothetical protein
MEEEKKRGKEQRQGGTVALGEALGSDLCYLHATYPWTNPLTSVSLSSISSFLNLN